ncbi:thymidine phosphorylase [Wenzhouxiangella limi]|uniref:Thymidine phosphorylase n=1 Tax=Wenzhouxiangella limi TaxID=2707351 RepID=A0A845VHD5_9GAMM|nr:thymidine phosphorylase [Wenzhouxiangella limi]NDY96609.1 thymidine phosphorylase [Wenzhouxiangella limi]
MLFQELIRAKRDGQALSQASIEALVQAVSDGRISDEQLGAFAMAVYWRGLDRTEIASLTRAMRDSGRAMQWRDAGLDGPVLDKHSTGGVGDATSLLIGPWVAACGGHVPMISGRGLGHTGGTLDKLAAIPGYDPFPTPDHFARIVREVGVAIIGQTDDLAPADRRLYAIRDVTATVDCLPLIVASILSKKLAEGLDGLVLDVKTGSGAFMAEAARAEALARALVEVATEAGTPAEALLTDMDQPLGDSAGNALEVLEVLDLLTGQRQGGRLFDLSRRLSARMLLLGGLAEDEAQALAELDRRWQAGSVAERFARMVSALGGPADLLETYPRVLARAAVVEPVYPETAGVVRALDMRAVGLTVVGLGGGRRRAADTIDPAVGLSQLARPGETVDQNKPLAIVHAADRAAADQAARAIRAAVTIGDEQGRSDPLVARLITTASKGG